MPAPPEQQDSKMMREMFTRIAPRYDFISRIFSYGMDGRWKRLGVKKAPLPEGARVLDLACGTGDFSSLLRSRTPSARTVACDITESMLRQARARGIRDVICATGTSLPFADGSFDCVFVGYGMRNFPDLDAALGEIQRVSRPGAVLVTLDFFLPANRFLTHLYLAYLYAQGYFWGMVLHGSPRIYTYIPDSLRSFLSIEDFSSLLERKGYSRLDARAFVFGGIGLHWAVKRTS
jgi:demethylmenaquinone methyltransferase / 2-methoxy-6-polyprenyl-1,4-benzoquinol methylase